MFIENIVSYIESQFDHSTICCTLFDAFSSIYVTDRRTETDNLVLLFMLRYEKKIYCTRNHLCREDVALLL